MNTNKPTRASVPPPKRQTFLPEMENRVGAANNMQGDRLAPMTFNMPKDWHLEFKMEAAIRGISMKDLLIDCFNAYNKAKAK